MRIKVIDKPFREALRQTENKRKKHKKPKRPNIFWRTLMRLLSLSDMKRTNFTYKEIGMDRLPKGQNAIYFMNHSSFLDLEIVPTILYPKPFNIVATTDAFVGKEWLLRQIGCIPTKKFTADLNLVRDILYASRELGDNIVMFPEAGYSFDGTSTALPDNLGRFLKMLKLPFVMIHTYGAFSEEPLYNNLHKHRVNVSATVEYVLSPEEIDVMTEDELLGVIRRQFDFDSFRWQQENHIKIDEKTRAEGLERVLYKCCECGAEGKMLGEGTSISCSACGKEFTLTEYGHLECDGEAAKIPHVPDWYKWEREEVRREILRGEYSLDIPVDIVVSFDTKRMYRVGEGRLTHTRAEGFRLVSADGDIDYTHKPMTSHTVCCDFNFYEIGDVISFGDTKCLYYCFPKEKTSVAKVRLAAEEIYKIARADKEEKENQ